MMIVSCVLLCNIFRWPCALNALVRISWWFLPAIKRMSKRKLLRPRWTKHKNYSTKISVSYKSWIEPGVQCVQLYDEVIELTCRFSMCGPGAYKFWEHRTRLWWFEKKTERQKKRKYRVSNVEVKGIEEQIATESSPKASKIRLTGLHVEPLQFLSPRQMLTVGIAPAVPVKQYHCRCCGGT